MIVLSVMLVNGRNAGRKAVIVNSGGLREDLAPMGTGSGLNGG